MQVRAPRLLALAAAALLLPASAGAIEPEEVSRFARNGFYLAGTGSFLIENFDTKRLEKKAGVSSINVDDIIGASGRFGYRFHPRWSAEVQGDWLNRFTARSGGGKVAQIEGAIFTVNGRFHFLTDRFQPYALLGVGGGFVNAKSKTATFSTQKDGGFAARFGAGFEFYLSEGFGTVVDAGYVLPTGSIDDYDYIGTYWGIFLRF